MHLNKLYRLDKYCEIPFCNNRGMCIPSEYPIIPHQLINCNSDEKLSCGCPAFEFYSHNCDCQLYNIYETDLISLSHFTKIPLWNPSYLRAVNSLSD